MMGQPTIRQAMKKKLKIIDNQVVIGTSGPVGLGQRFAGEIDAMWRAKIFSGTNSLPYMAMTEIRKHLWSHIAFETDVARCFAQSIGAAAIQRALATTIIALPLSHQLCLFQFDEQGSPEEATEELPFVAIGSGQNIADPFLAFLRRIFWPDRLPKIPDGILSAVWTLHHAIETNPGGVGPPMQIITLSMDGSRPRAIELTPEDIKGEHLEAIRKMEAKMSDSYTKMADEPPPRPIQKS
jgi:hypothetical protein